MTLNGKDTECVTVLGARVHNLNNIDVEIPHYSLTVITGLSGSGKSSLAFDTIFAEGQRRYLETFSAYARGMLGVLERPAVDMITGLNPVISIAQKTVNKNPRSTVGTTTEVYDYLRLLYARIGEAYSYTSGERMVKYTVDKILNLIVERYEGHRIYILAPLVKNRKGHYRELFENLRKKGFMHVRVDGELREITFGMKLDRYKNHSVELVVDRLRAAAKDTRRLQESIEKAFSQGDGQMIVLRNRQCGLLQQVAHGPRYGAELRRTGSAQLLVQLAAGRLPTMQGTGLCQPHRPRQDYARHLAVDSQRRYTAAGKIQKFAHLLANTGHL